MHFLLKLGLQHSQIQPSHHLQSRTTFVSLFTFNKQQMNCAQLYDNYLPCISWSIFFCALLCTLLSNIVAFDAVFSCSRFAENHSFRLFIPCIPAQGERERDNTTLLCALSKGNLLVLLFLIFSLRKWKIINYKRLHFTAKISRLVVCFIVFISLHWVCCYFRMAIVKNSAMLFHLNGLRVAFTCLCMKRGRECVAPTVPFSCGRFITFSYENS